MTGGGVVNFRTLSVDACLEGCIWTLTIKMHVLIGESFSSLDGNGAESPCWKSLERVIKYV